MTLSSKAKCEIIKPENECCETAFDLGFKGKFAKLKKGCCKKSFIKGVFMSFGSINIPSVGYNLVFNAESQEFAQFLYDLLIDLDFKALIKEKNKKCKVYVKDKDSICDLLVFMGAINTSLEVNSLIVKRNMMLKTNQIINCDMANLNKIVKASIKQLEAINALKGQLDEKLNVVARARLKYPESSYDELKDIVKVSKSTIKYRLNKILKLYEEKKNDEI